MCLHHDNMLKVINPALTCTPLLCSRSVFKFLYSFFSNVSVETRTVLFLNYGTAFFTDLSVKLCAVLFFYRMAASSPYRLIKRRAVLRLYHFSTLFTSSSQSFCIKCSSTSSCLCYPRPSSRICCRQPTSMMWSRASLLGDSFSSVSRC